VLTFEGDPHPIADDGTNPSGGMLPAQVVSGNSPLAFFDGQVVIVQVWAFKADSPHIQGVVGFDDERPVVAWEALPEGFCALFEELVPHRVDAICHAFIPYYLHYSGGANLVRRLDARTVED
jgi:hypothetical protein